MKRRYTGSFFLAATASLVVVGAYAQGPGGRGGPPQPPLTAKESAPFDITGYWVSLVSEDWRYRMLTPPKGDYAGVPLNAEARKIANAWDPAQDEAAGEQCKSYGAPVIMRLPGRLHITWQDDQTLKVETDAGTQTRFLYFGSGAPSGPSQGGGWQGVSQASWELMPGAIVVTDGGRTGLGRADRRGGSLKVITTKLKPGYLRKNGVPYSANAVVTEYYDRVSEPSGDSHLVITTRVEDPAYLTQPFLMSSHFQKQVDASGWNPTPCLAK
jgi:hypothetical protein